MSKRKQPVYWVWGIIFLLLPCNCFARTLSDYQFNNNYTRNYRRDFKLPQEAFRGPKVVSARATARAVLEAALGYYWGGSLEDVFLEISNPEHFEERVEIKVADARLQVSLSASTIASDYTLDLITGIVSSGGAGNSQVYKPKKQGYKSAIEIMIANTERLWKYTTSEQREELTPVFDYLKAIIIAHAF